MSKWHLLSKYLSATLVVNSIKKYLSANALLTFKSYARLTKPAAFIFICILPFIEIRDASEQWEV